MNYHQTLTLQIILHTITDYLDVKAFGTTTKAVIRNDLAVQSCEGRAFEVKLLKAQRSHINTL